MAEEYVSRQYLLNEYDRQHQGPPGGARKIIAGAPAADVVQVVRCQNCKHHTYDEIFASFWCEYPGRVRDTTPDGFCEKGEE